MAQRRIRKTARTAARAPGTSGNWLKFLGTAGARFVMIRQLRASGGIWISFEGTNILVDPGPGSLVRCTSSRPKLDPSQLDAVILTHRHLDHCNDINVIIEAMTEGGFKKRGIVFAPEDALASDPVILKHAQGFAREIVPLKEGRAYEIGAVSFETPLRHIHPVETYGLRFNFHKIVLSYIADTLYFDKLAAAYPSDIAVISTVFYERRPGIEHLCLEDARNLIRQISPKAAILTHFGMTMLKAGPHRIAAELTRELGVPVTAACDGMTVALS